MHLTKQMGGHCLTPSAVMTDTLVVHASRMGMQEKGDESHRSGVIFLEAHLVENEDIVFMIYISPIFGKGK